MTPLVLTIAPSGIQEKGKYAMAFMMGYMGLKGLEFIIDFIIDYVNSKKPTNKS
jgi:hypothetical protein